MCKLFLSAVKVYALITWWITEGLKNNKRWQLIKRQGCLQGKDVLYEKVPEGLKGGGTMVVNHFITEQNCHYVVQNKLLNRTVTMLYQINHVMVKQSNAEPCGVIVQMYCWNYVCTFYCV